MNSYLKSQTTLCDCVINYWVREYECNLVPTVIIDLIEKFTKRQKYPTSVSTESLIYVLVFCLKSCEKFQISTIKYDRMNKTLIFQILPTLNNYSMKWNHEIILFMKQNTRNPKKIKFGYFDMLSKFGKCNRNDIDTRKLDKQYFDNIKLYKKWGYGYSPYFVYRAFSSFQLTHEYIQQQTRKYIDIELDIMDTINKSDIFEINDYQFCIKWSRNRNIDYCARIYMFIYVTFETSELILVQH